MSPLFIFVTSFLIAMSGALMPGPLLTVTIKESLLYGWRAGFFISTGHGIAEIVIIVLFALGLNHLLQAQWISAGVGIIGGLVLLLMGGDIIRSSLNGNIKIASRDLSPLEAEPGSFWRPLREGLIVSIANPGWVIWWFSIGIVYVTMALQQGWIGLSSFYTGHILADFTWYVFIAFAVATGKKFMSDRAYKWILTICGILLVGLALFFMSNGVQSAMAIIKS